MVTDRVIGKGELEDLEYQRRLEASGIDREVKMGSYSDNYLSYILLQNNRYDYSGSAVKNNNNDSTRNKKYYCENREASL